MESLATTVLAFADAHPDWLTLIVFVAAFGESFVLLSFFFPGTALVVAAGGLMATGALSPLPVLAAACVGAILGDAVSFWLGRRFGTRIQQVWPVSRRPDLLPSGIRFFDRHGGKSVFLGRFLGPMRAVVPLAAGLLGMSTRRFWVANVSSAIVWAGVLLYAGDAVGQVGDRLFGAPATIAIIFCGLVVLGVASAMWAYLRSGRRRS